MKTKKDREVQEAIVRAMVRQNKMTEGMPTTRTVAKQLGMKAPELYKLLSREGVLTKNEYGYWFCNGYNEMGLARMRFFIYFDGEGEQCLKQYPVWTERGLKFLQEKFQDVRSKMADVRCN